MMLVGEQPGDQEDSPGARSSARRGGCSTRRSPGRDRPRRRLPHERGQALQVEGAREAADPRQADWRRGRRVPAVARRRARSGAARRARAARRDGCAGAARPVVPRHAAAAACRSRTRASRVLRSRPCIRPRSSASATARRGTPRGSASSPTFAPQALSADRSAKVAKLARSRHRHVTGSPVSSDLEGGGCGPALQLGGVCGRPGRLSARRAHASADSAATRPSTAAWARPLA